MIDLTGHTLGQYELQENVGTGGTASVYRAWQASMRRTVAVKVINTEALEGDPLQDVLRRFDREVKAIAALNHLHILKVYDFSIYENMPYMVMDYMPGKLADLIVKEPIPLPTAARLFEQICSAVDYANRRGIIHRDIKPRNVLLDDDMNAYLMDFGVAKFQADVTAITRKGVVVGTPSYMAPEQWRGEKLDARTDIYALGISLFEMLTRTLPYIGDGPYRTMMLHLDSPIPSINAYRSHLPAGLNDILQRALAKEPKDRFQTAGELGRAFRELINSALDLSDDADPQASHEATQNIRSVPAEAAIFGEDVPNPRPIPTTQIENYALLKIANRSRTGVTYQAHETTTHNQVALKLIEMGPMTKEFITSLNREAADLKAMNHAHIARIFECGCKDQTLYIAYELISHGSLTEYLRTHRLQLRQVGIILDHMAKALDYAHRRGIIHGDLKGDNVMLDDDGRWVVTDFGIVNILDDYNIHLRTTGLAQSLTERTTVTSMDSEGTPSYLTPSRVPPERWYGYPNSTRTDVYMLGLVLFEMLTGRPPFEGLTASQVRRMITESSIPLVRRFRPDIPAGVEAIVQTALQKDPGRRFGSAGKMAEAFVKQF